MAFPLRTPKEKVIEVLRDLNLRGELELYVQEKILDALNTFDSADIIFPELGGTYETQSGEVVKMINIANLGTRLETLIDEDGINRYSRRYEDAGRVTGTPHDYSCSENLKRPIRPISLNYIKANVVLTK